MRPLSSSARHVTASECPCNSANWRQVFPPMSFRRYNWAAAHNVGLGNEFSAEKEPPFPSTTSASSDTSSTLAPSSGFFLADNGVMGTGVSCVGKFKPCCTSCSEDCRAPLTEEDSISSFPLDDTSLLGRDSATSCSFSRGVTLPPANETLVFVRGLVRWEVEGPAIEV